MQKINLFQDYLKAEEERKRLQLPPRIEQVIDYEETVLLKEFGQPPKSKLKKKREFVTEEYCFAFSTLSKPEKTELYSQQIDTIKKLIDGTMQPFDSKLNKTKQADVYIRGFSFSGWRKKILRVNRKQQCIELERPGRTHKHDLYNYIYRKSKTFEYFCFVLEAINNVPKAKYKTIHLGFTNINQFHEWYDEVKATIDYARAKSWAQEFGVSVPTNSNGDMSARNLKKVQVQSLDDSSRQDNPSEFPQELEVPKPTTKSHVVAPMQQSNLSDSKSSVMSTPTKNCPQPSIVVTEPSPERLNQRQKSLSPRPILPPQLGKRSSGLVDRILKQDVQIHELDASQSDSDEAQQLQIRPNLLSQILPDYNLELLTLQDGYKTLEYQNRYRRLQNNQDPKKFKVFMNFKFPAQVVFEYISNPQTIKNWNTQVEQIALKTFIKSQNTAIIYMKIKAYSSLYRARDFLFIRHAFRKDNDLYLVDKSIENINNPPFYTIVRGNLQAVWGFLPNANNTECLLVIDMAINLQGFLNDEQNSNLCAKFMKRLINIQSYITQKSFRKQPNSCMFEVGHPSPESLPRKKSALMKPPISPIIQFLESPQIPKQQTLTIQSSNRQQQKKPEEIKEYSPNPSPVVLAVIPPLTSPQIQQPNVEPVVMQIGQIPIEQAQIELPKSTRVPELDAEGLSIISQNFVNTKYKMIPWDRELVYQTQWLGPHHIWRDQWRVDSEHGGCWFINQKKQQQQRKVFSYILSKMGKNLLSGKGILNVSLPVEIFSMQSNLQTLAKTFAFAPIYLEKAASLNDPLQQMKYVIAFGFTCSLLYAKMQKPFNPILGETLQCSFQGCPVFVQQVSHHPPIAAYYMVGRGYKFYGSIQSKMDLSLNSGTGYNAGDNVIKFDNGTQVRFRSPGGSITGLTFGQRKLTLTNKSFFWQPNHGYLLDITFNPGKKGFFSLSKQVVPTDYFEGTVKKVTKQFIFHFEDQKTVFRPSPSSKDILQEHYKVHGRWTKEVFIEDKEYYNVDRDHYLKYDLQPNPLPSDCMYREDVVYKRLGNVARSQNEKQRLQIVQRRDRKLRQKKGKL